MTEWINCKPITQSCTFQTATIWQNRILHIFMCIHPRCWIICKVLKSGKTPFYTTHHHAIQTSTNGNVWNHSILARLKLSGLTSLIQIRTRRPNWVLQHRLRSKLLHHADSWAILHPLPGKVRCHHARRAYHCAKGDFYERKRWPANSLLQTSSVTGNWHTLCKQSVQLWCCIFFTEHHLLCLQLALALQLRIHLTSYRLHFLDLWSTVLLCYALGLCFFNSSLRIREPPTLTLMMPL